jgi:hypothetical protein
VEIFVSDPIPVFVGMGEIMNLISKIPSEFKSRESLLFTESLISGIGLKSE